MKKIFTGVQLIVAFAMLLTVPATVFSCPALQLNIGNGTYNWDNPGSSYDPGTIIAPVGTNTFTLYAYMRPDQKGVNTLDDRYYISAALVPKVGPNAVDLGSFSYQPEGGSSQTVNVTGDMTYGVPPIEANGTASKDRGDLPTHGIFKTFFFEIPFQFLSTNKTTIFDTQVYPGRIPTPDSDGNGYFAPFVFNISGLDTDYLLHFDLYNEKAKCGDIDIEAKAPFSHDAQSNHSIPPVPEPGTMVLLGSGLIGLAGWGRKKFRK